MSFQLHRSLCHGDGDRGEQGGGGRCHKVIRSWRNWQQCLLEGWFFRSPVSTGSPTSPCRATSSTSPLPSERQKHLSFFWTFWFDLLMFSTQTFFSRWRPPLQQWPCQTGATLNLQSAWWAKTFLCFCILMPGVFGHFTRLVSHSWVATLADRSGINILNEDSSSALPPTLPLPSSN